MYGTGCPSRWIGLGPGATQREKAPLLASPGEGATGATGCPQVYLLVTAVFLYPCSLLLVGRLFPVAVKICLPRLLFLTSPGYFVSRSHSRKCLYFPTLPAFISITGGEK